MALHDPAKDGRRWLRGSTRAGAAAWTDRIALRIRRPRPPSREDLRLTQRNVFVLPTRAGLLYAVVLVAMLIGSINYALSLGFMLTFLLGSIAMVGMLHTFRNLSGLVLRPGRSDPVFAGQPAEIGLALVNAGTTERFSIRIDAPSAAIQAFADLPPNAQELVHIAVPAPRRGLMPAPRLRLSTEFPLGLFRAWAYWQPAIDILVYPAPEPPGIELPPVRPGTGTQAGSGRGHEDVAAVRPYRAGDPVQRIAWRAVARSASDQLLTKELEGGDAGELALDWTDTPVSMDPERRISRLVRWVLDADASGRPWSLHAPGVRVEAGTGPAHRQRCLEVLALMQV